MNRSAIIAVLVFSACGFNFDAPSAIKDLRILAVQVDPPELTAATVTKPLSIKALVVDTTAGEAVPWSLATCIVAPRAGTSSSTRCPSGGTAIFSATTTLDQIQLMGPIPPTAAALVKSKQTFTPQLQVELTVGDAPLYAEKAILITSSPIDGQDPNTNPVISSLTFDGQPWSAGAPISVKFGSCTADQLETITNADRTKSTFCTHKIVPAVDDSQQQTYTANAALTGTPTLQQEKMRFAWFADQGVFHNDTTQQAGASMNPTRSGDISNVWREVTGLTGEVNFWVVIRDGRGGESWEQRQLHVE